MTKQKIITCRDVMNQDFDIVEGVMTVGEALHIMRNNNISQVIIKKRDPSDEYGMVQLSDIAKQVIAVDRSPNRVNLYEIMAKPVISVRADMNIKYCARLFQQFGLQAAPVREGEEIIGIVSYRDIVLSWIDSVES